MTQSSDSELKEVPVFICYRQVDGRDAALWLYKHLNERLLTTVGTVSRGRISVYLDTAAPAVSNWQDLHLPSLERSRALIFICTPGVFTRLNDEDWVHMEVDWWLKNREMAPIIIDAMGEGDRWLPKSIKSRWPNTQRVELSIEDWKSLPADELELRRDIVIERITSGIIAGENGIHFEELEKQTRQMRRTKVALVITALALLCMIAATAVAIGFARLASHRQEIASTIATDAKKHEKAARESERKAEESKLEALAAQQLAETRERVANRNLALSLAEQAERAWLSGDVFAAQAIALKAIHHTQAADIKARCLALHYLIQEDDDKARIEFSSLLDSSFEEMLRSNSPMHRVQRLAQTSATRPLLDSWISLCSDHAQVYKEVLRFKGLSDRIEQKERTALRKAADLGEFRRELGIAESNLAHLTYHGTKTVDQQSWSKEFERSSVELAELYQSLSSRSDLAASINVDEFSIRASRVRASLQSDEAIVHFALSRNKYFAWVLQPNYDIVQIEIGSAKDVEEKVSAFTSAVAKSVFRPSSRGVGTLIVRDERETDVGLSAAGAELKRLLWDPLSRELNTGVSLIYFVPDGILWTTPIYALPISDQEYLIDRYTVVHALTPFDLLDAPHWVEPGTGILLIGNVEYDDEGQAASGATLQSTRTNNFLRLPGTEKEIVSIGGIVESASSDQVLVLRGRKATEQALRSRSQGFRVIHLATHGWATHKLKVSSEYFDAKDGVVSDIDAHLLSLDPSLLAGVALAGANSGGSETANASAPGLNDGILTGMEAASLNIDGVELVVLSGCDTVGVARAGQSLFGLVNAFRAAGAKTIVASLYPVADQATADYMAAFYQAMLTKRIGPARGLRNAALELKANGSSAGVWASFVSYGDLNSAPFVLKASR